MNKLECTFFHYVCGRFALIPPPYLSFPINKMCFSACVHCHHCLLYMISIPTMRLYVFFLLICLYFELNSMLIKFKMCSPLSIWRKMAVVGKLRS